MMLFFLNL